jgi:hypothetical protein
LSVIRRWATMPFWVKKAKARSTKPVIADLCCR